MVAGMLWLEVSKRWAFWGCLCPSNGHHSGEETFYFTFSRHVEPGHIAVQEFVCVCVCLYDYIGVIKKPTFAPCFHKQSYDMHPNVSKLLKDLFTPSTDKPDGKKKKKDFFNSLMCMWQSQRFTLVASILWSLNLQSLCTNSDGLQNFILFFFSCIWYRFHLYYG